MQQQARPQPPRVKARASISTTPRASSTPPMTRQSMRPISSSSRTGASPTAKRCGSAWGAPERFAYGADRDRAARRVPRQARQRADLRLHPWRRVARRRGQGPCLCGRDVRAGRRTLRGARFRAGAGRRRQPAADGGPGAPRHRLDLEERRALRRRSRRASISAAIPRARISRGCALIADWAEGFRRARATSSRARPCAAACTISRRCGSRRAANYVEIHRRDGRRRCPRSAISTGSGRRWSLAYGTYETPEFQRQARDFAAAVTAAGKKVELAGRPATQPFRDGRDLANPFGLLGRAVLDQIGVQAHTGLNARSSATSIKQRRAAGEALLHEIDRFGDAVGALGRDAQRARQADIIDLRIDQVHADEAVGLRRIAAHRVHALLQDAVGAVVEDDPDHGDLVVRGGPQRLAGVHGAAVADQPHHRPVRAARAWRRCVAGRPQPMPPPRNPKRLCASSLGDELAQARARRDRLVDRSPRPWAASAPIASMSASGLHRAACRRRPRALRAQRLALGEVGALRDLEPLARRARPRSPMRSRSAAVRSGKRRPWDRPGSRPWPDSSCRAPTDRRRDG